jgi:hypothetical protein
MKRLIIILLATTALGCGKKPECDCGTVVGLAPNRTAFIINNCSTNMKEFKFTQEEWDGNGISMGTWYCADYSW